MTATMLATRKAPEALPDTHRDAELLDNLDRIDQMPVMSDSAVRAMALMNDPMAKISAISELVRRDGVLAASILKLANTWAFRGRNPIEEVHQAVMRLGLRECSKLITAVGMKNLYSKYDKIVVQQCDSLLQHSFFTACLAMGFNRLLQLGFSGEEFTAGLLHDIGRVILCVKAPYHYMGAELLDFDEDGNYLDKERNVFGTDHCTLGSLFARKNDLPPGVSAVITYHHHVEDSPTHQNLIALIATADRLANHAQREHRISDYKPMECPGYRLLSAKWDARKHGEFQAILSPLVVKAMKETRGIVKSVGPAQGAAKK